MLRNLHVKNIALIDDVEIEFKDGMHVLSGETGAGKSIIIDAVNFTLGKRMPKDVVREDADYALCELTFSADTDEVRRVMDELDIPCENDEIIMQRKINKGRSSCKINGESVSAGDLRELAEVLIDIHGQHEHQSLLYKKKHLEILDDYCGSALSDSKEKLKASYGKYKELLKEYNDAASLNQNRDREISLAEFEINEIQSASLTIGEDEQLENDYRRMSNAKRIAEAVSATHMCTGYETDGAAGSGIGRAVSELRSVSDYDPLIEDLLMQLTDIDGLLNDFNRSIADYEKSLVFEEHDFIETEERLNLVNHLKSKYGKTIEDILDYAATKQEMVDKLNDYEAYLTRLQNEAEQTKKECLELCKLISDCRKKEAVSLAKELREGLVDLNFLDARLEITINDNPDGLSENGYDDVEFMISTNPGEKLKSLIDVASGGELSRIMLALKAVLSRRDKIATLIFDEIDTGISGRTAQKVSEKLAYLSREHQVICVTHLPQIAAMADVHLEISKQVKDSRTVTSVKELTDEEITVELARMLSGAKVTDAVLENAREMKKMAQSLKNS